ncbi:L,D-transpeptidase family protein [Nostocoides sp. F2B08]|uniref:L,D-transpeptidase n=1 Tax=Nostocoides sp. F2B08 TaxID=2653936 RepID=UPI001263B95F|nr:L,D-transpeptidase [Tetrasphaera sp. F2B08]KAB7743497.1 L,D-transpeptidase family protein [Tetrasphaera sp. F2B08]
MLPLTYGASTPGTHTFRVVVTVGGTRYYSPTVTLTRTRLDPRCYTSGVVVCASKNDRKVYYVDRGRIVRTLDARFGGRAYDVNGRERMYSTAEGTFYVTRKVRNEVSYTYDNTPMPFSVYFYGGQAFHYSYGFARDGWVGDWGSHGCVNLRDWAGAEWLFNHTKVGTKVVVYR